MLNIIVFGLRTCNSASCLRYESKQGIVSTVVREHRVYTTIMHNDTHIMKSLSIKCSNRENALDKKM